MWVKSFLEPGKLSPPQARALSSSSVRLGPGMRVGEHSTGEREELILVLDGEATLLSEGTAMPVPAGHAAYVPPDTRHDVENRTGGALAYVYVTARTIERP